MDFNIHNYHWIWYIIGFIFAPKIVLLVLMSVYLPISITLKFLAWILVGVIGTLKIGKSDE
jgi:hypothetical protein